MGDITSLKNHTTSPKKGSWLTTQADIVIKEGKDKPKMFSGHISDYFISTKTGDLESIILRNAKRWCDEGKSFKPVSGDALMIPYSNILDLNLTYVTKAVDHLKIHKRRVVILNMILILGIMFCIIFPLFTQVSFFRKLAGMMALSMALLSLIAVFEIILGVKRSKIHAEKSEVDPYNKESKKVEAGSITWSVYLWAALLFVTFSSFGGLILGFGWPWVWILKLIRLS